MRRALVTLLFLLSGAAALAYQVAWTRHLVLVFGNTTRAVALILAAYMLGLALGSEVGGRLADRVRRPVLLYAAFEAGIGALALLFPTLVALVRSLYLSLGTGASPVLFAGAFLVLLGPTFLMGTTLPLLVRTVVRDPARTGGEVGLLYGANIIGAVLGTAAAGFWLIEAAGVIGSTRWAAALNVFIALLALAVPFLPLGADRGAPAEPGAEATAATTGDHAAAALLAAFAGGLVGLAAEVVWTRLLVFFLQGFTYTFSALLAMFLLGLALGGFVFGRVALRSLRPAVVMGRLQVLVGVASAAVLLAMNHHLHWTRAIWQWVDAGLGVHSLRPRHVITLLLASAVVLLVPSFLMGGVFPLACAVYRRGLDDLGARIGRLYAVNTIGAVLGSLGAGFVLSPLLGPAWAAAVVAILAVSAGILVLWISGEGRRGRLVWASSGLVACGLLLVLADPGRPFLLRSHAFQGGFGRENTLLETRNGTVCQVSVVQNERDDYHLLYTDEFQAAGTRPEYRYMRMLAHLPVALAEDPSRVLVVCYGTGTTCGSAAMHPTVSELDIVEISPQVLEVADYFAYASKDVLRGAGRDDLAVRVHVDDGRNFVLRSAEQWGVISLEPLMPYTPAAIHFYTEDFYRECRPRLLPGGVMCQWIPIHGMSTEHLRQLVAAFVRVFPGAAMFHTDGAVALIGGHAPITLDHDAIAARLGHSRVREDLAEIGYADPVRAIGTFVASGERLAAFGSVTPMTDEHPTLEFHPLLLNVRTKHLWENLGALRALREGYDRLPVTFAAGGLAERYDVALDVGHLLLEGAQLSEEAGLVARASPEEAGRLMRRARRSFLHAVALDPTDPAARRTFAAFERNWHTIVADGHLRAGELEQAEAALRRAAEYPTEHQRDVVHTELAQVLNRQERFPEALRAASEATRLFPGGLLARAERAFARAALGDVPGAAGDYARALRGAGPEELAPRLRRDAERALRSAEASDARPLRERIESALAGHGAARVSATALLGILAADEPEAYAAHFEGDMERLRSTDGEPGDRMLALKRLQLAAPQGAAAAVDEVARAPTSPESLARASAEALAELSPLQLRELLVAPLRPAVLEAAARAAGSAGNRRLGAPLVELLEHDELDVRRAAHRSLFRLSDGADDLARLDPSDWPSETYRAAVERVRALWRSRDGL